MSATRSLPRPLAIAVLAAPARSDPARVVRGPIVVFEDEERLPRGTAYAIIVLMSVACWGLVATVGLWLWSVLA